MTVFDILDRWASYVEYDPGQTRFNLMSNTYKGNRCCKKIEQLREFDPTGELSVMYAKKCFLDMCEESRVKLLDILRYPDGLKDEQDMWAMFHSDEVMASEKSVLDTINRLVEQVTHKQMIGQRDLDGERESLLSSVESVVDDLTKCRVDLFQRGSEPIGRITRFSACIHVFDLMADCLMALESAEDGIYLVYITNHGSSDGYFSFFIKSNGNILSINERQNEAYPGQHGNCRNGRWQDAKGLSLFPYSFIFSFAEMDYKGYASKYMIDSEQLSFLRLQPKAYMPLILAMVMLTQKYQGTSTEELPLMYSDALLSVNVDTALPGGSALAIPAGSQIALAHRGLTVSLSAEQVMDSAFGSRFDISARKTDGKDISETGYFAGTEDATLFTQLYGAGFHLDSDALLEANPHLKVLPADQLANASPNAEFIGTEARFEMLAYMRGREQLAEYIREQMFQEYLRFGGCDAVKSWYDDALKKNREAVMDLLRGKVLAVAAGTEQNVFSANMRDVSDAPYAYIAFGRENRELRIPLNEHPFNESRIKNGRSSLFCPVTGASSSILFFVRPRNWMELETLTGVEVPKIVKGWSVTGHHVTGNPILNATDAVTGVGTPFELDEAHQNQRYWTQGAWANYYFHHSNLYPDWPHRIPEIPVLDKSPRMDFAFVVGFSNRGFKQAFGLTTEQMSALKLG